MDQTTHDVRRTTWQSIIKQCQEHPEHITVKIFRLTGNKKGTVKTMSLS